ncbi:MAG: hypothetical protein KDA37_17150, partial [Planctomycetales bacterium]|nr:hypothetical protein [Planctomycetales bacterium]
LSLDLARIAQFAAVAAAAHGQNPGGLAGFDSSLGGQDGRLQVTVEGSPGGLKASLRVEDGALKLLVAEGMKQSAQAAAFPPGAFPPGGEFPPEGAFPPGGFPPDEEVDEEMPDDSGFPADEEAGDEDPFGADSEVPAEDPFSSDDPFGN